MTIMAEKYDFVIGVDTHARNHVLAVVACPTGNLVATKDFRNTTAGIASAIRWTNKITQSTNILWAIEGCGSYGSTIAKTVMDTNTHVIEAPRYQTSGRGGNTGKTDQLDALRIASAALAITDQQRRLPRQDTGIPAALQTLITAREMMTKDYTAHINALTALLRSNDLNIDARRPLTRTQITTISTWRKQPNSPVEIAIARSEAVRLATRIITLISELKDNQLHIEILVQQSPAATLTKNPGVGPVTAAVTLAAWSHHGRLRSEAAFASLAGVNPIPASSGNTTRHRLNRAGDRRINRALHSAVISAMRCDQQTKAYVEKRTAEGKTTREIRRCLKRYLARKLYRQLNHAATTTPA